MLLSGIQFYDSSSTLIVTMDSRQQHAGMTVPE
jgi:hypothetical protein